jgi:hypothetical protein
VAKRIKEGERLPILGKELVEDNFIGTNRFFRKRQIVQPISGARYFGEPVKIEHTDHFTIAKPASPLSIQHRLLVEFANTVARRHRQDQSRERPASFESDNPVLLEWSEVLGHKLADAPRTISRALYENRLKVAAVCLVPLLLAFGFSYFGLIRERAAEAELLVGGSARIRGTDGTIFLFTTAKKIIEYDSTGDFFPERVGEFKYLGPIAIRIRETHSEVLGEKQGFQIPPGLGALSNIVGLNISNAEWLDDLDPLGSMPHLEALIIGKAKFSSLHFLTKFPNLRLLFIQEANITDLEPLASLTELRQLFLNDLPGVSDLKPLRHLSKLRCISLRGLPKVESLETLLALPNLTTISIRESARLWRARFWPTNAASREYVQWSSSINLLKNSRRKMPQFLRAQDFPWQPGMLIGRACYRLLHSNSASILIKNMTWCHWHNIIVMSVTVIAIN